MAASSRNQSARSSQASITVEVERLPHGRGLDMPRYQTAGSAGLDLAAAVPAGKPIRLEPMQRALVPTGLALSLPDGVEAQVRPRSGLALRHGVTVLNSPGTIDSDYRGEVQVILVNLGRKAFKVERGERIAQLVIAPVVQARIAAVARTAVTATARGAGGFGSTGMATAVQAKAGSRQSTKAKSTKAKSTKAKAVRGKPARG